MTKKKETKWKAREKLEKLFNVEIKEGCHKWKLFSYKQQQKQQEKLFNDFIIIISH